MALSGRGVVSGRFRPVKSDHAAPPALTGTATYVGDLCDDSTLYAHFVRSTSAHAVLGHIDVEDATGESGVVGVYTASDLALADIPGNTGLGPDAPAMSRPPLARDRVRFVGDPVAVVVAETEAIAVDAAGLIWPEYEELPAVVDMRTAAEATPLFPGGNVVDRQFKTHGEFEPSPDRHTTTIEVANRRLAPTSIEPLAILARPDGDDVRVYCGHQAPHRLRDQLAHHLDRPPGTVRVTVPAVGGAFGMKGMLFPEYLVVTALALKLGRPVAWICSRREQFSGGTHGRGQHHTVTLEGTSDGRIDRAAFRIVADTGAYPHNGSQIAQFTRTVAQGLYDIPCVEVDTTIVVTNTAPTGSYRGAGRPEAALAIERAIDAHSRALELDPVEVRLINMITPEQIPYRNAMGALYDSGDYPQALRMTLELLDLDSIRADQQQRLTSGGPLIGVGIGAFVERAGGGPDSSEYGRVEVSSVDKSIVVRTGSTDSGQSHARVWGNLIADIFEVERVAVIAGDTAEVAEGTGTFASRSAQLGASAVAISAHAVLAEARQRAADQLEAAEPDIRYSRGTFTVAGVPGTSVDIWDLDGPPLASEETFSAGAQTFPYGVHAAVVEIEPETGVVTTLRIVSVDDCGTVLDPEMVEGQLVGSLTQGLGQARFELVEYGDDGQLLTSSMMDYSIPHAADMPAVETDRLTHPAPSNPLGAKGAGEAGCIGLPPAILNAAIDALWPLGVRTLDLPLTPHRVWQAIQAAADSSAT